MKATPAEFRATLPGRSIACYFEKPSTRTRVSFAAAVAPPGDAARAAARRAAARPRRADRRHRARPRRLLRRDRRPHLRPGRRAADRRGHATCRSINALTDEHHPCQALADLLTLRERVRRARRAAARLRRRRQQRRPLADGGRRARRRRDRGRLARRATATRRRRAAARSGSRRAHGSHVTRRRRPARGRARRRRRLHRRLGLDGRGGASAARRLRELEPYRVDARADGATPLPTRSSCTACPPTAARRSPPR